MYRQVYFGLETQRPLPNSDRLVINRVVSDVISEGSHRYYQIETVTRSLEGADVQSIVKRMPAEEVAELFRNNCQCGGELRFYRGMAGYEAMVCRQCGHHWNGRTPMQHLTQLIEFGSERKVTQRFTELCHKCCTQDQAKRLWNWADNQTRPEPFWVILGRVCPWAFRDATDANSLIVS